MAVPKSKRKKSNTDTTSENNLRLLKYILIFLGAIMLIAAFFTFYLIHFKLYKITFIATSYGIFVAGIALGTGAKPAFNFLKDFVNN